MCVRLSSNKRRRFKMTLNIAPMKCYVSQEAAQNSKMKTIRLKGGITKKPPLPAASGLCVYYFLLS